MKFLKFYIRHLYLPPCRQRATKEIKIRRRKLPSLLLSLSPQAALPPSLPLSSLSMAGGWSGTLALREKQQSAFQGAEREGGEGGPFLPKYRSVGPKDLQNFFH